MTEPMTENEKNFQFLKELANETSNHSVNVLDRLPEAERERSRSELTAIEERWVKHYGFTIPEARHGLAELLTVS